VSQGAPPTPAPPWPPSNFFEPPSGQPRVKASDLIAEIVARVGQVSPEPPKPANAPVLLAQVTIKDPKTAVTDADIQIVGQPVLLSQYTLLQMVLSLWERVEQGLAALGGGKA
jgi:hypothetical protein